MSEVERSAESLEDYLVSLGYNVTIGIVLSENEFDKDEFVAYIIGGGSSTINFKH